MQKLLQIFQNPKTAYHGTVDPAFQELATCLSQLQADRLDQGGAAVVVYFRGEKVVDLYLGQQSQQQLWQPNTMAMCYSTGKGVLATLAHCVVSDGHLTYDTPIAEYWPEFAANGKAQITFRDVLSHQSGLFDIRHIIDDASEMLDWAHMLEKTAAMQPRFIAKQDAAYQALTFGWLVGGILEKATQQTLQQLMQDYLIEPLSLSGAYFGVSEADLPRIATPLARVKTTLDQKNRKPSSKRKSAFVDRVIEWSGQKPEDFQDAMIPKGMKGFNFFSETALKAVIPAANGVFDADSLAKIYAMLAQQGIWQGQTLIAPAVFQQLSQMQYTHRDRVMPIPMHWRLGYHRILSLGKRSQGFGHMGFNGSGAWCDPERQLSFAYIHNFPTTSLTGDYRLWALSQAALRCADGAISGRKGWF